jgi:hypothetical protein
MAEQFFRKKDPNPSVCGMHIVRLFERESSIDAFAPHLGRVICLT